jgi:hypothetical protein
MLFPLTVSAVIRQICSDERKQFNSAGMMKI